ncbi:Uncharacterised protein [Mycobacteroides abscessus subsp. abscessus]|nr:Uncharacterised protein [Mycobacteroides abscessus subsp. abscessus]
MSRLYPERTGAQHYCAVCTAQDCFPAGFAGATTSRTSGTAVNVRSLRSPRKSPSTCVAIGADARTRTHGMSSSRSRCLAAGRSALGVPTMWRTRPRFATTFMLLDAKMPKPLSKPVPGLVQMARSLA